MMDRQFYNEDVSINVSLNKERHTNRQKKSTPWVHLSEPRICFLFVCFLFGVVVVVVVFYLAPKAKQTAGEIKTLILWCEIFSHNDTEIHEGSDSLR